MRVLKFGGSSVASAECIRAVCKIVAQRGFQPGACAVVVSAIGGVTDALHELARHSERTGTTDEVMLGELRRRHVDAVADLATEEDQRELHEVIERAFLELGDLLRGVGLLREASPRSLDRILAWGESLSSQLVAAAFRSYGVDARALDARALIVTDDHFGAAHVDEKRTYANIVEDFATARPLQVVTGFIAATEQGHTTTLGRGGSDTTAAIFAAALSAEALEIWTDVDGVMSADPRIVPDAIPLARMSYEELMELSHFGAKVVHPPTVHPARAHGIPLLIKNTFRPEAPGTLIVGEEDGGTSRGPVSGIASISPVSLLRLEGDGMVGVPGIAGRLFAALARTGVNVILISQASSEHSICFAVRPDSVTLARNAVAGEFAAERGADMVRDLVVERDLAVVAVVGAGMREQPGIAGRVFGTLGSRVVNVRAIAQGSSELNVSLVVAADDMVRAVNALHGAFFLSGWRTAHVAVAGVGKVGAELLRQMARRQKGLRDKDGIHLLLAGACNSRHCLLDSAGLSPTAVLEELQQGGDPSGLDGMVRALCEERRSRRIFVDCTASDRTGDHYETLLDAGVSVVTANKRRLAGSLAGDRRLRAARPGRLYYEATVGAGLPVIGTLLGLLATGDRLRRFEGVLSGTLSYLLGEIAAGKSMSAAIRDAHERGFTEPDPREDLGGMDVARKLLILGRIAGYDLEPEDIQVTPLLAADPWSRIELGEFWKRLGEVDQEFAELQSEARQAGQRLSYLARLEDGVATVKLTSIAPDHACWDVVGGENLVAYYTDRYGEDPLVVRGPGAGPAVTAAGVFADVLQAIAEDGGDWG